MATRNPLIAGNWKMHGALPEAVALATEVRNLLSSITDREILVAPAFPVLAAVGAVLTNTRIRLGAQNLHWEEQGAFTGEVSGAMLRSVGCSHVIVGHSERRQLFGDTDESVARKVRAALRNQLAPIVCVGETLAEREADRTMAVVERQTRAVLEGLRPGEVSQLAIAYEPVWAIGTGKVATPDQAQEVHRYIRNLVQELAGAEVAAGMRILYGGSVKPDNIDALMRQPDLDGALVGGASLKAEEFARIAQFHR